MEWIKIGKITKAHGIKGEVFVHVFAGEAPWLSQLAKIHLSDLNQKQPQKSIKIESSRWHKTGFISVLEGIKDRNLAEELKGQIVWIPRNLLISKKGENFYLVEIKNFKVKSKDGEDIGEIVDFSSNGAQDLAIVQNIHGEHSVPLVDEFIVTINFEEQWIQLDLPEGLVSQ